MDRRGLLCGLAALCAPGLLRASAAEDLTRIVGQLVMTGFAGRSEGQPGVEVVAGQIARGEIGGVLLLDRNVEGPGQLRRLTARLRRDADPFVAIDQEGGRVARLRPRDGFERWLSAREIGRRMDAEAARAYYAPRARALAGLGIDLNLAPVVDLDLGGPAIGRLSRAYGSDPAEVAALAVAAVAAHRDAGVATALKHFPGHGSAPLDSHRALPDVSATWRGAEMEPFRALIASGHADMVMTAHLDHPLLSDGPGVPASLSARTVHAIRALGFDGIVVTDDLLMRAVSDRMPPEEAAIRALAAGSDLLILSAFERLDRDIGPRVNAAVVEAIRQGRLSMSSIARSHLAVSDLKARLRAARA